MSADWKVIYYEDENSCFEVMEFIEKRMKNKQVKIFSWLSLLEERGPELPQPYSDLLKDGIHELRIKLSGKQTWILYFFCFKKFIVLTNVFIKTIDTAPEKAVSKANERRNFSYADLMIRSLGGYTMKTLKRHFNQKLKDERFKEMYIEEKRFAEISLMLHEAREMNALSQKEVAKKAHITQQQLSKVENGVNCNIITFLKVCNALGLDINFNRPPSTKKSA